MRGESSQRVLRCHSAARLTLSFYRSGQRMAIFSIAAILFFVAFGLHLVWWRIRRPKRSGQLLIVLFVVSISLTWVCLVAVSIAVPAMTAITPAGAAGWLQALLLALGGGAAYVMTYPAIEVESPTLVIVDALAQSGAEGISIGEFTAAMDNDFLVRDRIDDLVAEGLVRCENGLYSATPRGIALARAFIWWRAVTRGGIGG